MEQDVGWDILRKFSETLESIDVPFWITDGTLLGFHREGKFLEHDHDIDFGIHIDSWRPELISSLTNAGFKPVCQFGSIFSGLEYRFSYRDISVDLFFFYPIQNKYWHAAWANLGKFEGAFDGVSVLNMICYVYEAFSLEYIDLQGLKVRAPKDRDAYVLQKYGPGWREPVLAWDWRMDPSNAVRTATFCHALSLPTNDTGP